jgi:hypothetical protein
MANRDSQGSEGVQSVEYEEDEFTFRIDSNGRILPPRSVPVVRLEDLERSLREAEMVSEGLARAQMVTPAVLNGGLGA